MVEAPGGQSVSLKTHCTEWGTNNFWCLGNVDESLTVLHVLQTGVNVQVGMCNQSNYQT
jgi:hypothetical protein